MAITKFQDRDNTSNLNDASDVLFICPICKSRKELPISKSVINQSKQLTTISIPSGLCCKHSFQAFVDKNFKVRGYQKVDFEFESRKTDEGYVIDTRSMRNDDDLFKNLVLEGNYLKYEPKVQNDKKEMTLEGIYEEFWEFIDEDNPEFQEFIIKDKRRKVR